MDASSPNKTAKGSEGVAAGSACERFDRAEPISRQSDVDAYLVELNREIEAEAGFSAGEIFSLYGQDGYRRYERSALDRIVKQPGATLLAAGGGIVSDLVTFEQLLANFFTVWIKASPSEHMSRVRTQGDLRPMAEDKAAMSELVTILQSRELLYARARATLDTSRTTVEESSARLLRMIRSYCVSGCPWQSRNLAGHLAIDSN